MNILSKIKSKIPGIKRDFNEKNYYFSSPVALFLSMSIYMGKLAKIKHKILLKRIQKIITETNTPPQSICTDYINDRISADCPIWVMWWQGKDAIPLIVKKCMDSIERNKGNHPVIYLDSQNYTDYIDVPKLVIDKCLKNGWIAYVSDIIRYGLLSKHGGIWLDATIYVSKPIGAIEISLYSIRHANGNPRFVLDGDKWSVFMFASTKDHPVVSFIYKSLLEYFNKESHLIDYWLTDYIIAILYQNRNDLRTYIDEIPLDNPKSLELVLCRDEPFEQEKLNTIFKNNRFNKLDWRLVPKEGTMLYHVIYNL